MGHVYLSGSWHPEGVSTIPTDRLLEAKGVKLFNWRVFQNMSLQENAVAAVAALKNCTHYAAILDNPEHRYQGTFELMAIALSLGIPVSVFIPNTPRNPGEFKGDRIHQFRTSFDRFWLYHPGTKVFVGPEEYDDFISTFPTPQPSKE